MTVVCRRFVVSGRVQGVFFRDSTRSVAESLGLTGHALNKADGTVEVLACGEDDAIDQLNDWLHRGPPMAIVATVKKTDVDTQTCVSSPDAFLCGEDS